MTTLPILYATIAYIVLFLFLGIWVANALNQTTYRFIKENDFFIFLMAKKSRHLCFFIILIITVLTVLFDWIYGVFGEPSVLTLALTALYVGEYIANKPLTLNKKAVSWFGIVAFFIVLTALGAFIGIGIDFYHRYFDGVSLAIHYVIVAVMFGVALMLDKKSLWLAWFVLLGFVVSLMSSVVVLDYVSDIWLFMFGLAVLSKKTVAGIKKISTVLTVKYKKR